MAAIALLRIARRDFLAGIVGLAGWVTMAGPAGASQTSATPETAEDAEALATAGLVGPASYRSPLFGYTVAWDDAWQLRESVPGIPPARTNPEWGPAGRDDLFLVSAPDAAMASLSFITFAYEGLSREERFEEIISSMQERDTWLWDDPGIAATVGVLEPDDRSQSPVITVSMLLDQPEEAMLHLGLQTNQKSLAGVLAAVSGVELDGTPIFADLPAGEIVTLVAAIGEP